jgi:tRNA (cytidine56-2'-O)-methyltransferase
MERLRARAIVVLRLGHRYVRDKRLTTHLFLAARAFGAEKAVYTGVREKNIEENVMGVVKRWGGSFRVEYAEDGVTLVRRWQEEGGAVIHLTMYGLPVLEVLEDIRDSKKRLLVVVGGAKVAREIYGAADWNVAVTSQPHSEVSALSVFLHELFDGGELSIDHGNAELTIVPQAKGKKVVRRNGAKG